MCYFCSMILIFCFEFLSIMYKNIYGRHAVKLGTCGWEDFVPKRLINLCCIYGLLAVLFFSNPHRELCGPTTAITEICILVFMVFHVLQIATTKESYRKTWNAKYTLRSHFDGVRALAFHPVEPVLITASEDHTLKLWNLQKTVPAKKWVLGLRHLIRILLHLLVS